jgi:hypothetical protein
MKSPQKSEFHSSSPKSLLAYCAAGLTALACSNTIAFECTAATVAGAAAAPGTSGSGQARRAIEPVARGRYLVKARGCAGCSTQLKMGASGPEQDFGRGLSCHPQELALPPATTAQGTRPWGGADTTMAFCGPWGVAFAANATSDKATGIGAWADSMFINAIRRGKQLGGGRPLLPTMPWPAVGQAQ